MLASRQITSINFADTFAHSLFKVREGVKNIAHILVEAFVTTSSDLAPLCVRTCRMGRLRQCRV